MNEPPDAPIVPAAGESFPQTWIRAVSRPNEQNFAALAASPRAKAMTGYLWFFIGFLIYLILGAILQGPLMRNTFAQMPGASANPLVVLLCTVPITAIIGMVLFAAWTAIVQWLAQLFGGHGTQGQLAYVFGAISAPFLIVIALLSLLSVNRTAALCIGPLILLLGLYAVVLELMAVKGVNHFGWGPALGALFIPLLLIGILCGLAVAGLLALLGPTIRQLFQQLQQSIPQ